MEETKKGDPLLTEEGVAALGELLRPKTMYPSGSQYHGAVYTDKSGKKYRIGPHGNHIRTTD